MDRICGVWNVYIHEDFKIQRMVAALQSTINAGIHNHQILIRGPLREKAKVALREGIPKKLQQNLNILSDEPSRDWKLNTLFLVERQTFAHYLLLQEDHLLIGEALNLQCYFQEVIENKVSLAHVTFHQGSLNLLGKCRDLKFECKEGNYGYTIDLSRDSQKIKKLDSYLFSLVGLYERELLVDLLSTILPIKRKYPPFTPFDFELTRGKDWFLPRKISIPKSEIFACIDDGLDSLQSRGLYPLDQIRKIAHNVAGTAPEKTSIEKILYELLIVSDLFNHKLLGRVISRVIKRAAYKLRILSYIKFFTIWFFYMFRNHHLSLAKFKIQITTKSLSSLL